MRTTRYLLLTLLMALFAISAEAQQRNVLQLPDISTQVGNIQLPINIENTDEIVGAQFDITLPEGITAEPNGVPTNRSNNHTITVSRLSNGAYRVLLHSLQNAPLRGQSGTVMYLPINIPTTYEEGSQHSVQIDNAVLGKATGENVLTESISGSIHISKLPDLTVKNITCDKEDINPGEHIIVSWQVENIGELATGGGWSEQISLVSKDGTQNKLIATTHYNNAINANDIVSRQVEINLPALLGIDGDAFILVRVIPNNSTGESTSTQDNNSQKSNDLLYINKVLSFELSTKRVEENKGTRIALRVNRSGLWTKTETFTITTNEDNRVSIPSTLTIPANQASAVVYFNINDNNVLDNDSLINITVTGNEYPDIIIPFTIDDNELPTLSVTTANLEFNEGENFQLTVTTSRISAQPITATITCENARRFTFPQQIIIPAGETSARADVTIIDNDEIEIQECIAFQVSANKYERGECIILLNDNDMPTFTFTLSPEAVSESDGYGAIFGVIKRTDNLDKRVTLRISDDSNGLLTYSNKTITLAKNQEEVQFNIGVTNNNIVDGNHVVNITASVYASSCNCYMTDDTKGTIKSTVVIIDDDGPTLKIKPVGTAMLEGSINNIFTISHNTQSSTDVAVKITSDKDDILEYEHELIIPAGQTSAELMVNVMNNEKQDDSNIATFNIEANGYAQGSCWILITDQTLPDAIVSLYVDKIEVEAEQSVLLSAVVKNIGNSTLSSTTPLEIIFSGRKENVTLEVGKDIAVGDSAIIEYNYNIPAITGNHSFEAVVNKIDKEQELIYANNISETINISIVPPFSATAQTNKSIYQQIDSIFISGTATGSAGRNANIEIYLINEGSRQTIFTTSDEDGNYTAAWKPLSKQSGHFIVGACYPGSNSIEKMAEFDIYGIQTNKNFITCELGHSESTSGTITVTNPCNYRQTGLKLIPMTESENCQFTFNTPEVIEAGESVEIEYTVKANEISTGREWQRMPIEIVTTEGSHLDYTIYYFVHPLKAKLETNNKQISTTMTYGIPREYPVTIRNIGKAETGKITFALPDWIQVATAKEMASLAHGDSATILLRFIPTEAMKLNLRVKGNIGINCANGDGTSISFVLTPVSDKKGTVKVDVVDEYTYFTNEAPHVSKAKVRVKNPSTNEIVAEGETEDDGTFTAELPEGYYSISVDADKHDSYTNTIIIDPGTEKEEEVFLSYQAITYSWEVKETTIEDEYEIETIAKYETRVPKPVVIITLPDERPEPNSIIPVVVTNKGLVNALDFNLTLTVNDGYTLEFLNNQNLDVLAPEQSHIFYAKLIPTSSNKANKITKSTSSDFIRCVFIIAQGFYKDPCEKNKNRNVTQKRETWGRCMGYINRPSDTSGIGGTGAGGPGSPSLWNNKVVGGNYTIVPIGAPVKNCDGTSVNNNNNNNDDSDNTPDVSEDNIPENEYCDEDPILIYKLISNDGKRKEMKGVAADGVSQLMIVLDPEKSKLPSQNCDWTCNWRLADEGMGKLSNENSWNNVIYTAPFDFPGSMSENTVQTSAIIEYASYNGEKKSLSVPIEIVRTPLVLLHGLNDDYHCWEELLQDVCDKEMYKPFMVNIKDYKNQNCDSFMSNLHVASERIEQIIKRFRKNKYIATKADLVGHSMGGILSRLHVQYVDNENVHKVITVNTPHSGSEIGDLVKHSELLSGLISDGSVETFIGGFYSTDAIYDLAVNSTAIDSTLNKPSILDRMHNIPIHSITTIDTVSRKDLIETKPWKRDNRIWVLGRVLTQLDYGDDILSALCVSDDVVSGESQNGGLEGTFNTTFRGGREFFHCSSPKNENVINEVKDLLQDSIVSDRFYHYGFHPVDRTMHFTANKAKAISDAKLVQSTGDFDIELSIVEDSLEVSLSGIGDDIIGNSTLIRFTNDVAISSESNFRIKIPSTHNGEIFVTSLVRNRNNEIVRFSKTISDIAQRATPISISCLYPIEMEVGDTIQYDVKVTWSDGSETYNIPEGCESSSNIIVFEDGNIIANAEGSETVTLTYKNLSCECPVSVYSLTNDDKTDDNDNSNSICTTVILSFKQKSVMTRQAFRGTLTINNGSETDAMKDVKMNLEVHDTDGNLTTSHEFQIDAESLNGFIGDLDFTSGWSLAKGETGVATILFIPTKYAAPTEAKEYSFGGSFSYTDPNTGLTITRDLSPVTLTVKPSPNLEMIYFMQRDIYGDDPLTIDIEPKVPAEFALIVNNKGYGDAENMNITTHQPQIIDNQKGLAITFKLISTALNGKEKNLSFGGSMTSDFGTIPAQSQAYAQWWLESSLLGHFTDYDVEATHVTSYGNEDLSLLDNVTIHELIHGFTAGTNGDVPVRGFLVNEITDKYDTPDQVYFSDATQQDVATNANITIDKQSDTEYLLTVNANNTGLYYGSILDPTNGKQNLVSVVRESDGLTLPTDNIWQTDRTLCDGRDWLYENRLHFVGEINNGNESYLLTFEPKPEIELEVESIIGIPEEGTVLKEQLTQATVKFNVPIKPETFTAEDLTLTCQGAQQDVTNIQITQVSETEFTLNLSAITLNSGYYMLTVQTATIEDTEGFNGSAGKQEGWIQFIDGKVALSVTVSPAEGGSVTPTGGSFDYDSDVTLKATAAEGYDFTGWTLNGETVSQESEYTHHLTTDTELSAHFTIKHYYVTIGCDATQGAVAGAATGIYDHGTVLELLATPATGYEFDYWALNEECDINNPYSLIVNRDITIDAQFREQITTGIQDAEEEALNVSITPLPLQEHIYINGNFNEIEYVNIYSMNGSKVVGAYNVQPQEEIYVGMLQAGIYFIVVETDRGVFRTKVIKR